ncbi:MAG: helix-turn-helix domain-containing protein, partial [Deltaproteobacteria bacterium]|nr:helix-turn-helix domain-containing protein [Deltaproteobacteria bacterium]
MKPYYSIAELSKILDISARSVRNRVINEGWKFNNGKRRVYLSKSLPRDVRRKIISHQIGCALDFIPSKKFDVSRAEAGLKKWNKATEYNRKTAQARDYILNKSSEFIKSKNFKQTQGEERFEAFYNAGLIKVEPWILEKISRVSASSLRRWRGEKAKHGLPGLLGEHGNRQGQSTAFTPEHRAFTISHIMAKSHIRPSHIFKLLCKTFEVHPSKRTVYR